MKRTLIFYDLILNKNNQMSLLQDKSVTLKDRIEDFVEKYDNKDMLYINNSNIIQIEDISSDYIFGSYGKTEKLSDKSLTRGRAESDMTITDLTTLEDLVESYTYFYLDLNKEECIILNNPNCPGFKTEFSKFLLHHFRLSGVYENIKIVNKLSEQIPESIGRSKQFAAISYTYSTDGVPDNEFLNFQEISNITHEQIKTAVVQLYFDANSDFEKVASTLSNTNNYVDKFSSFKIETDTQTIDVIEKILSKKVSIPLDEDQLNNTLIIKNILIENLINY